jgi:shikimate kinase
MKIYLVGLAGSGKTTLGKQLAAELQLPFVDLDWEIEKREHKSVREIFAQQGEDFFRKVESEILREWAVSQNDFVMGTGGGAPCFFNGMEVINKSGLSIFLDVPLEVLSSRLTAVTDRPLLDTTDSTARNQKLESLRTARLPIYTKAHIIVQDTSIKALLQAIKLRR